MPVDTTAPEKPGDENSDSSFNWDHLGNVMAGLVFHDLILVFVIALVLVILRFAIGYDCSSKQTMQHIKLSEA